MPKKLSMYSLGLGEQYMRAMYSKVKNMVNMYSHTTRVVLSHPWTWGMLSMMTSMMLSNIAHSSTTSKALPMGVSLRKIMV